MNVLIIGDHKFEDFIYINFLNKILSPVRDHHNISINLVLLHSKGKDVLEHSALDTKALDQLLELNHRNLIRFYSQFKNHQFDAIIDFSGGLFGPILTLKKNRPLLFSMATIASLVGLKPLSTNLAKMPVLRAFIDKIATKVGADLDLLSQAYPIDQSLIDEEIKLIHWSLNTSLDFLNSNYILVYYHMTSSKWSELERLILKIKSTFKVKILVLLERVNESEIQLKRKQSKVFLTKDVFLNHIDINNFNHLSLALWKAEFVISNKESFCVASSYFDQNVFHMSSKNHFGFFQNIFRKNHISKIISEIRIDELHYVLQKMVLQKKY